MMQIVETRFTEGGLGRVARRIAGRARECLRLMARPADPEALPIGASRFGGRPDLPVGLDWPRNETGPLNFLTQIDTATLPVFAGAQDLPAATLLSFFYDCEEEPWGYDPAHRSGWRVIASPAGGTAALRRCEPPDEFPPYEHYGDFRPCRIVSEPVVSLPDPQSAWVKTLGLSHVDVDAYVACWEGFGTGHELGQNHQLLGLPNLAQGDMELACQLAANGVVADRAGYKSERRAQLEPGAADWRLLLQIDSDDAPGFMWADAGRLYFWIRRQDLAAGQFDRIWVQLQSG